MNLRIDEDLKNKFQQLAQGEGKSASEKLRELISGYIRERDIGSYVEELWDRTGEKFEEKGIDREEIDEAIQRVRSSG